MAAGRNLVARFILSLRDNVSPGLAAIRRRLDALRGVAGRIGAIGAVVAGISFMAPIQGAAALEGRLRDLAVTAGQTGDAVTRAVSANRTALNGLALEFRETTTGLLGAMEVLTARGLEPEAVRSYTRMIAEVRAASGAAENDLAQLAIAFERIAKVDGEAGQRAGMAAAFRAGQLGGAELKDMARYLPTILSSMGALGVTGQRAIINASSMLQVLRDGMGTMEEAAGGARQLLGQLLSENTVKVADELGENLRHIYTNALAQMRAGRDIDPIEALFQAMRRAVGGREERVFQLIPDENARNAFLAWSAQAGRYIEIRRELRQTGFDVVSTAAATRMQGLAADMREFTERTSQIGDALGNAFGVNLRWINPLLQGLQEGLAWLDDRAPGLSGNIMALVGAAAALTVGLGLLGAAGPAVVAGMALIGGPVTVAALVIVGAGMLIWEYWEELEAFFNGLWQRLKTGFSDFSSWLSDLVNGEGQIAWLANAIRTAWEPLGTFFSTLLGGISRQFTALMDVIRPVLKAAQRLVGTGEGGAAFQPEAQAARSKRGGSAGRAAAAAGGFYAPEAATPGQRVTGEIVVRAAPGTEVESARGGNRDVPIIAAPERGPVRGLP